MHKVGLVSAFDGPTEGDKDGFAFRTELSTLDGFLYSALASKLYPRKVREMTEHPNFTTKFDGGTYLVTTSPERKYKQIELIGKGGYGAVILCRRKRDRQLYAVKIIEVEEEKRHLRKQLKEMEILAALQGSPYIVGFVECLFVKHTRLAEWLVKDLKTDRYLWCVMELCGKDIWACMKDIGHPLNIKQILSVCAQTLLALEYIHEKKIVHRDIKGLNILTTQTGRIKICDFGFSEYAHEKEHELLSNLGTSQWMAPEMFFERPYQYEVDIWALGITILEMYRLKLPFDEYEDALRWASIKNLPEYSEGLQRLALKLPDKPEVDDLSELPMEGQMYELAYRMLNTDQKERPTAIQLMKDYLLEPLIEELRELEAKPCVNHEDSEGEDVCRCRQTFGPIRELFEEVDSKAYQYHQDMKVPENVARS